MWNPFVDLRKHPQDSMFRWRVPFLARGAINVNAGHWKALGVEYRWNWDIPKGWSDDSSIRFWGLLSIVHRNSRGGTRKSVGPEWSLRLARAEMKWVPADMY